MTVSDVALKRLLALKPVVMGVQKKKQDKETKTVQYHKARGQTRTHLTPHARSRHLLLVPACLPSPLILIATLSILAHRKPTKRTPPASYSI